MKKPNKKKIRKNKYESFRDMVMKEYEKGNVVFMDGDGIALVASLKDFVKQPAEGILYDLNRMESVVLTYIKDPKWVNDFAVAKVIKELKRMLEEKNDKKK